VYYREALQSSYGDFLRRPGIQEQFSGKHIAEAFRIYRDVEGISGATISASAMYRGIRNSARRVALAYLRDRQPARPASVDGTGTSTTLEDLERLTWLEMLSSGLVARMEVVRFDALGLDLTFSYMGDEALGNLLLGSRTYAAMVEQAREWGGEGHLMFLGLDGSFVAGFRRNALTVQQGGESFPVPRNRIMHWGRPTEGKAAEQVFYSWIMLIDPAVDLSMPVTFVYDDGNGGPYTTEFSIPEDVKAALGLGTTPAAVVVAGPSPLDGDGDGAVVNGVETAANAGASNGTETNNGTEADSGTEADGDPATSDPLPDSDESTDVGVALPAPDTETEGVAGFDFADLENFQDFEEETAWSRMLDQTRWARVWTLGLLFGLVLYAFLSKSTTARWVTLGVTLLYLGFVDGGFLSVSHIASGFAVGPGFYLNDLVVLLMVVFTLVTTLLWGRVFCGFLCPFGALQDFLEKVVPRRFQRKMPGPVYERAIYVKYAVLALIVGLAAAPSHVGVYQYFEPFATVFYLGRSPLLWGIAGGILVASAVIPRFYCRYACPLGAALGLASLVSIFRIDRVEQCDHCKVCEFACPTGAISGSDIDFKECVRCNICEVKLQEGAGVCRHTMDEVRSRLIKLETVAR
jgi:ferredoxin